MINTITIGADNYCPTCKTHLGADPFQQNKILVDARKNGIIATCKGLMEEREEEAMMVGDEGGGGG